LGLATINLYTKYEVSMFTYYEDTKGNEKCKNWGGLDCPKQLVLIGNDVT